MKDRRPIKKALAFALSLTSLISMLSRATTSFLVICSRRLRLTRRSAFLNSLAVGDPNPPQFPLLSRPINEHLKSTRDYREDNLATALS